MDRMAKIQGLKKGKLYNSFNLAKGFIQNPIPEGDRKYFGFYFAGRFYVFKDSPLNL